MALHLPLAVRVLRTLRDRAPGTSWPAARVVWCVRDYEDLIDVLAVAGRLADAIAAGDMPRMKDGPATLRAFCQREKERCAPNVIPLRTAKYDRLRSPSETWPGQSPRAS